MSWASAIKEPKKNAIVRGLGTLRRPTIELETIDWARLVSLDFETKYDDDYTLSKLSTSEYIRDPRFETLMVGIKIGRRATKVVPGNKVKAELAKIDWKTHSLLCHNTQFDGFILSHHYKIVPKRYYCSLSMARALHSNDIGAGLDEVSQFYGGKGKIAGGVEGFKGLTFAELWKDKRRYTKAAEYCGNDVDEMLRVFECMAIKMPVKEMDLIHLTTRMFCDPVLKVDLPRVQKELERETARREKLLLELIDEADYSDDDVKKILKTKAERALIGLERQLLFVKRVVGSNEHFAALLRSEGVEPPIKISKAWIAKDVEDRTDEGKYSYAFAKDDLDFVNLPDDVDQLGKGLNLARVNDVKKLALRQARVRALVDARIAVKSTTNITRAERFLKAGANGWCLPVGYAYYRAHCLTGDAQVLTRTGWVALAGWTGGEIAQWSPDGKMTFAKATPNSFAVKEKLVRANSRYHQCTYTLGHTVPAFTSYGTFAPRKAGNVFDARFELPISGELDGASAITELQAQIAVMVQADGNIRSDVSRGRAVRFGFIKQRKIDRCKKLLDAAGIEYTTQVEPNGVTRIRIGAAFFEQATHLLDGDKQFSLELLDASSVVKHAFVNELAHWDGDVEPATDGFTYSTTSKHNAEFVQTMAHLAGQAAHVSARDRHQWATAYRVYIRSNSRTRSCPEDYSLVDHDGLVYCPTTETGYFLVRQNGKIVVTGNTGRWGGNNKMNMQNLTRGGELRLSILAPAGYHVCVADSGQIEARVNAWLWGQDDLLEAFRDADNGGALDAYCRFASEVYRRQITKDDKTERFVGKVCVLGLGYQMGAAKLQMTLAKGALGGPPIYLSEAECQNIVRLYRRKNHRIARGWDICNQIIEDMAAGRQGSHGPLVWEKETIWLPNGMALKYPDLRSKLNDKGYIEWTYQAKDMRKKIYGGLLCENLVQALARIIVGYQMLDIDKVARAVMTTHDEVVTIARKASAPGVVKKMLAIMRTPLDWCPTIPLNAEGGHDFNYSK